MQMNLSPSKAWKVQNEKMPVITGLGGGGLFCLFSFSIMVKPFPEGGVNTKVKKRDNFVECFYTAPN